MLLHLRIGVNVQLHKLSNVKQDRFNLKNRVTNEVGIKEYFIIKNTDFIKLSNFYQSINLLNLISKLSFTFKNKSYIL